MSSFYGSANSPAIFFDIITDDITTIEFKDVALGRYVLEQHFDGDILCGGTIWTKIYDSEYQWKEVAYLPVKSPDYIDGGSATDLIENKEEQ